MRVAPLARMLCAAAWLSPGMGQAEQTDCPPAENIAWEIQSERPLPPDIFTQGFEIDTGDWWLSGGGYGRSRLLHLPHDGAPRQAPLSAQLFAEGLSLRGSELWLLTWRAGVVLVLNRADFTLKQHFRYDTQGWGLAWNARSNQFLMSNGSSTLQWRNATDFRITGSVDVRRGEQAVANLNELEIVGTNAFANIWQSDEIVRIDLHSGCVNGSLDLSSLWPHQMRPASADVLNGIAFDKRNQWLWVTGKYWGRAYGLSMKSQTFK